MVSPTLLCWRYHSLPLSQRYICQKLSDCPPKKLNSQHGMWPLNLTLTLTFQGQMQNLLHLSQNWSDCHETNFRCRHVVDSSSLGTLLQRMDVWTGAYKKSANLTGILSKILLFVVGPKFGACIVGLYSYHAHLPWTCPSSHAINFFINILAI